MSSRTGYLTFKLLDDAGNNLCAACPVDPGSLGSGRCWVAETDRTKVSLLLSSVALQRPVSGRVTAMTTDCTVYQMTLQD